MLQRQQRDAEVWARRRERRAKLVEANARAGQEEIWRSMVREGGRVYPVRDPQCPGCPIVIQTMEGLGDTIYQRPLIRAFMQGREEEIYIRTSWPELLDDLDVKFVFPATTGLRTQRKNSRRQPDDRWAPAPKRYQHIRPRYMLAAPKTSRLTIVEELGRAFGVHPGAPLSFDLPDMGSSPVRYQRYAVIRPVTIRREWANVARAPRPEYVARAAELLRQQGYKIVSVADVDGNNEWLEGPAPVADKVFHGGELDVRRLMALCQHADVLVGGVGWIVPAALHLHRPTVIIGGGQGMHNAPWVICDKRMDLSRYEHLLPEPYCECAMHQHKCQKDIPDFDGRFLGALEKVTTARREAA